VRKIFTRNVKSILTFEKQGLCYISANDRSTIQAVLAVTILAIFETFFGLLYSLLILERIYDNLLIHGIISTFSIFEIFFHILYPCFYAEELHLEITISLVISSILMFYVFTILFSYALALFTNKLGGNITPINCFRIIGLSFAFEIIFLILIEPLRLYTVGTPIPWEILSFIPLILQLMVITFGITTISELHFWKVSISTTITYFITLILAFIIGPVLIKGLINDLFDYRPGIF
jgi:hypothetical protein